MQTNSYTVSVFVDVHDPDTLIKAARRKYLAEIRHGRTNAAWPKELRDEARHDALEVIPDVSAALRYFIDPGKSPPGASIQDSACN